MEDLPLVARYAMLIDSLIHYRFVEFSALCSQKLISFFTTMLQLLVISSLYSYRDSALIPVRGFSSQTPTISPQITRCSAACDWLAAAMLLV